MNYVWLAPGRLEYFYRNATDKDFFLGALSGPGTAVNRRWQGGRELGVTSRILLHGTPLQSR